MDNRFENFTILIAKINRNIKKLKNQEMSEYNLKSCHGTILYFLYINKSLTASDLCEKCEEDKGTISRSLNLLEKNGLVVCNSRFQKRYNSPFELSNKGLEVSKKIVDKVNNVLDEINDCLNEEDRIKFYNHLIKISNSLERISENFN